MKLMFLLFFVIVLMALAIQHLRRVWRQTHPGGHTQHKRRMHVRLFLQTLTAPVVDALTPMSNQANWVDGPPQLALANAYNMPVRDPEGEGRFFSDVGAVGANWLLYKRGSDENHVTLAGAGDNPIGPSPDRPKVIGDQLSVWYLGNHEGTMFGVASGAIAADDILVPAANGTVSKLPVGAGTYYPVGLANTAAVDGQMVSYRHRLPYPSITQ